MMAPIPLALRDIEKGTLLPLGVSTARRSRLLPDVPTIAEAGVPGFEHPIWYGLWAPAATPPPVVDKLAMDIARALDGPNLSDWLVSHGAERMTMTQSAFALFVAHEAEEATRLIQAAEKGPR
jgi:tripartite-type tricarboxylate transporter receptor subunit TctC